MPLGLYTKAIVRRPSASFVNGLTRSELGPPDMELALAQHRTYVGALEDCNLMVQELEAKEEFPDSTFIEDTAVMFPDFALITRPGAESRRGEVELMKRLFGRIGFPCETIDSGTLDGGDVIVLDDHVYIGLSKRTNSGGARTFGRILDNHGYKWTVVPIPNEALHLREVVNYIGNRILVCAPSMAMRNELESFDKLIVPDDEAHCANMLAIGDNVLIPMGAPKTLKKLSRMNYKRIIELDISEFQKMDGGLTCLSLRS